MRTKALLSRLRQLHNMRLLHNLPPTGSSSLMTRSMSSLVSQRAISTRVADSAGAKWADAATCSLLHAKGNVNMSLGFVRFMGVGSHKEGNRAGQHGAHYPHAKADGSPEKAEADAREQFLEQAKAESASNIDEPVRDAVESGQTIEEATTELHFGVKDGKNTDEATKHASEEVFKRSTINAKSGEPVTIKEGVILCKYPEFVEVSSEAKDQEDGTDVFLDKVDFRGREDESVVDIGGLEGGEINYTDEALDGSEERARENMKARPSPQAGVIVGHVPPVGANAIETEDDRPKMKEESTDETLNKAQKEYQEAIFSFSSKDILKGFEDKDLKDTDFKDKA